MSEKVVSFTDLTWEDLENWAGAKVVSRAKSYRRRVEDLRVTAENALVAWVEGTDRYATFVSMDANGKLSSQCTCPYSWGPCKHAVAVILAYLDDEQNKRKTPKVDPDDERFGELAEDNDNFDSDDLDETTIKVSTPPAGNDDLVRKHLEGLSKSELVNILLEGKDVIPELRQQLSDRVELKDGNAAKLIAATKREIEKASRDPGWTNHWRDEGHIPDYSRVKQRLENLLAAGQADAVVELGPYLMKRGIQQIEQSNDDGETGMEIAESMEPVFKAIQRSSLSTPQRLLWEIDLRLMDDYSLLDGIKGALDDAARVAKADWNQVADLLAARLAKMPGRPADVREDYSSKYKREQAMFWLLRSLEQAGRNEDVLQILERETAQTQCYVELVKKLAESGQADKAREWARKGFVETLKNAPGIAWRLEEQLREIAERVKNVPLAASYRAMEFFDKPDVGSYSKLEKAANKAGVWDAVREPILNYLETGRRPDIESDPPRRKDNTSSNATAEDALHKKWPLPPPELPTVKREAKWSRFPDISTLIDIAIKESRHDDALRWYRKDQQIDAFGGDHKGAEVAHAVSKTHPTDAIDIWEKLVSSETTHANVSSYQTAGGYLKKMLVVYERTNRKAEWNAYLADLRQQNSRRPRMLEVLSSLEGRRTPIMKK